MKLVIIKRYTSGNEAYIDAGMLRENGIECAVNGDISGTVLNYIQEQVTLCVREEDVAQASELLSDVHVEA